MVVGVHIMRVNLECGNDIRMGYCNVNNMPVDPKLINDEKFVLGNYKNLDELFDDNTVDEIIFNPKLNVVEPEAFVPTIEGWKKKLKIGGRLIIGFTDIRLLSREIHRGNIDLQGVHNLIFGDNNEYKNVMDLGVCQAVMTDLGFSIDIISPKDFSVSMEMTRCN